MKNKEYLYNDKNSNYANFYVWLLIGMIIFFAVNIFKPKTIKEEVLYNKTLECTLQNSKHIIRDNYILTFENNKTHENIIISYNQSLESGLLRTFPIQEILIYSCINDDCKSTLKYNLIY